MSVIAACGNGTVAAWQTDIGGKDRPAINGTFKPTSDGEGVKWNHANATLKPQNSFGT